MITPGFREITLREFSQITRIAQLRSYLYDPPTVHWEYWHKNGTDVAFRNCFTGRMWGKLGYV